PRPLRGTIMPALEFDFGATTGYFNDIGLAPVDGAVAAALTWSHGFVDNGSIDNHPVSIALEFRGNLNIPHCVYRTATVNGDSLKHAYWDPPNWIRET